jgi:hypothetical protein
MHHARCIVAFRTIASAEDSHFVLCLLLPFSALLSFIAFTLAFTSFFTKVSGTRLPTGNNTTAFVVVKPATSFAWSWITGGRTCRRMFGVLKLNHANIPS